jgi:hypothetical protein
VENGATVAISIVFAAWWVISAFNQFYSGAWTRRLRGHIPLNLIPLWTFFAPNPARADTRIVWRLEDADGWRGWREMYFGFSPQWRRWIINPELILNKAINDLVSSLAANRDDPSGRGVLFSSGYLTLLSLVAAEAVSERHKAVQFAVVRTAAGAVERNLNIVFVSEAHEALSG